MDKTVTLILQFLILTISLIYFFRSERRSIKLAIGLFILSFLGLVINSLFSIDLIGAISYTIIYLASIITFVTHLFRNNNLKRTDKGLLGFVLFGVLINYTFKVFHLPIYLIVHLLSILTVGVLIYLNLKKINQIREELRIADLFGIIIMLDILRLIEGLAN